jgi:hypothetical protein
MSGIFKNINPPPPSPPGGGGKHSLDGEGEGGQYFGRRQTLLCSLHMSVLCGPGPFTEQEERPWAQPAAFG